MFAVDMEHFDQEAYLKRIGLVGQISPDEAGLFALHNAQAFTIPFENLDILLGREINLDPSTIFDKLVLRNRGGYCFELNGLFYQALLSFGFQVDRVLARVMFGRPTTGPDAGPRTHQAMIVTMNGKEWLCDVGFGGPGMVSPIPVISERVDQQFGLSYRLLIADGLTTLQKQEDGAWMNLYRFDRLPVYDLDLTVSNFYTSCWPKSLFKLKRICSLPTTTGRLSLMENELTINEHGQTTKLHIDDGASYASTLKENFGLSDEPLFADFPTRSNT